MLRTLLLIFSLYVTLNGIRGEKIIINTDAGVDDAFAILMLLRYEESQPHTSAFEVVAITCSYGNAEEKQVRQNVLKTLTIANRTDIPVYGGAQKGFIEPFSTDYHYGRDGFGDFNFSQKITAKVDESKESAEALVDLARRHAGNISVLSIAPTTNIALAIALDSNFTKNVRYFYVMGGTASGVGNARPNVEFNFAADPESNLLLFSSVRRSQITLLPWETHVKSNIPLEWRLNVFGKYDSPYMRFLNAAESVGLASLEPSWIACDAVIAACVIEESIITSSTVKNVDPVTDGKARGSVLVDYSMITEKVKNSVIIRSIDFNLLKAVVIKYLTCEVIDCNTGL